MLIIVSNLKNLCFFSHSDVHLSALLSRTQPSRERQGAALRVTHKMCPELQHDTTLLLFLFFYLGLFPPSRRHRRPATPSVPRPFVILVIVVIVAVVVDVVVVVVVEAGRDRGRGKSLPSRRSDLFLFFLIISWICGRFSSVRLLFLLCEWDDEGELA